MIVFLERPRCKLLELLSNLLNKDIWIRQTNKKSILFLVQLLAKVNDFFKQFKSFIIALNSNKFNEKLYHKVSNITEQD